MFKFISAFLALVSFSLFTSAFAAPATVHNGATTSHCNTGSVQCCQQMQSAGTSQHAALAGLLGVAAGLLNGDIGVDCSPIGVLALGQGVRCDAHPVCCEDNSNGFISAGCVPATVTL
ncbi:fungal hydrophobin [Heliocybe sulcata]|uniref:Hydrophobin n=1 Tax=Heliocybe sulcata TaxID=5364 RepID=A0A5C3MVB1_9AGAM|nr:fungal hydrophobin [Heliocybe sulcata]